MPNSNDNIDDTLSINPIVRYDLANADWSVLRAALRSVDWQFILQSANNTEGVWDSFSNALWQIIDVTVEKRISKTTKTTKGKKYLQHIKRLLDRKLYFWRLAKKTNKGKYLVKYKEMSKQCISCINKYNSHRKLDREQSGNLGSFYKYANSKTSYKSGVALLMDNSGNLLDNDSDKA